jgi:hypothetical protein
MAAQKNHNYGFVLEGKLNFCAPDASLDVSIN